MMIIKNDNILSLYNIDFLTHTPTCIIILRIDIGALAYIINYCFRIVFYRVNVNPLKPYIILIPRFDRVTFRLLSLII